MAIFLHLSPWQKKGLKVILLSFIPTASAASRDFKVSRAEPKGGNIFPAIGLICSFGCQRVLLPHYFRHLRQQFSPEIN
jgi:hypothetical protein